MIFLAVPNNIIRPLRTHKIQQSYLGHHKFLGLLNGAQPPACTPSGNILEIVSSNYSLIINQSTKAGTKGVLILLQPLPFSKINPWNLC